LTMNLGDHKDRPYNEYLLKKGCPVTP